MQAPSQRPIICIDTNERYANAKAVESILRESGYPDAQRGAIVACCEANDRPRPKGRHAIRYGRAWMFDA